MSNSIISITKEQCFGCRSCEQICPKKCISFFPDNEGFLYPEIDENKCVKCELCFTHCPVINKNMVINEGIYLGLYLKDTTKIMESASGGVFAALADYVISNHGVVFGCVFDERLQAKHIKVETMNELQSLKGSKYVSSDTLKTYSEVASILKNQKSQIILYSGTPCQIHGLYSYLGTRPENLITADVICHGVPSQKLFNKYIEWLSKKYKSQILYY